MEKRQYTPEFKKAAVEKFLIRGSRPVAAIVEELGVPYATVPDLMFPGDKIIFEQ